MVHQIFNFIQLEWKLEWRKIAGFYGIILFLFAIVMLIYLTIPIMSILVWNIIFWLLQTFLCVLLVTKNSSPQLIGQINYLHSIIGPIPYMVSKIIVQVMYMIIIGILSWLVFRFFIPVAIYNELKFLGALCLGSASLAIFFTFVNTIALKISYHPSVVIILGFPLLIPLFIVLTNFLNASIIIERAHQFSYFLGVVSLYDVLIVILALILTPFLWSEHQKA